MDTPLDPPSRVVLFQAIRELAHNVVKHATATAIMIRIASERGFVRIDVEDDGDGFDPRAGDGATLRLIALLLAGR